MFVRIANPTSPWRGKSILVFRGCAQSLRRARMTLPVLLQPDKFEHWLSGNMSVEELKPAPNNYLQRWAVSKRVNSSKADSQFSPSTTVSGCPRCR
jgi:hypothetical protein